MPYQNHCTNENIFILIFSIWFFFSFSFLVSARTGFVCTHLSTCSDYLFWLDVCLYLLWAHVRFFCLSLCLVLNIRRKVCLYGWNIWLNGGCVSPERVWLPLRFLRLLPLKLSRNDMILSIVTVPRHGSHLECDNVWHFASDIFI